MRKRRGQPAGRGPRAEADGYALTVGAPHQAIPALLDYLETAGRPLARLTTRQVSLEDVFVTLTGRHLREEEPEAAKPDRGGLYLVGLPKLRRESKRS